MKKNIIARITLAACIALSAPATTYAQDIHWTQFDMSPLVINPAFTGMFDGTFRAAAIYRNQWSSVTIPYVTFGASADMPIITENNGDYLAAGLQLYKDQAGDGNLQNFTGLLSVAYHKALGEPDRAGDLAVGLQGGYAQRSIDLTKLYFGDEFLNGNFVPGMSAEYNLGMGSSVNYYLVSAGLSYSKRTSDRFSYVLGLAANNINQPNDAIQKKQTSQSGLDMRYSGTLGINWITSGERLAIRPAVLFQYQSAATEIIAGSEFNYQVGGTPGYQDFTTAVFLGGWYRTGDAAMITAGVDFKGFRIGLGYDYNISSLNNASNGKGGFEIAVRYIAPTAMKFAGKRVIPCTRF